MATVEDVLMVKGPDVIIASGTNTVSEAARLMAEANVGSVIIKENDDVAGIFTERDLLRRVVAVRKDCQTTPLSEVMSSPVMSCSLADDIEDVATTMGQHHIRHVAVVEDDALVGLIGLRDVLQARARQATQG